MKNHTSYQLQLTSMLNLSKFYYINTDFPIRLDWLF